MQRTARDAHKTGRRRARGRALALATAACVCLSVGARCGAGGSHHEPIGAQTFTSPQSNPIALSADGTRLYVANTTSGTVSVIDTATQAVLAAVRVGLEPVGLAIKPNGSELWVSNHVSDSVSVIDLDAASETFLRVVETVQDLDAGGVTQFDEPVGIAFASDQKAYVALSSRDDIAVIDATSYRVTGRIHITAQEPRAITVRGGRLYVAAFESGNQTELSICPNGLAPPQCTLDSTAIGEFVAVSPNLPGQDTRIVVDPDVPDRDLFVFSTLDESPIATISGVGTLLYGLAVSSTGEVYVSQTEARNADNGAPGQNLVVLENRIFLNQIGRASCGGGGCGAPSRIDLEPLPPSQPAAGSQLATPYGLALSGDDSTLFATAAGTSRLFSMDSAGNVLDILDLHAGVNADFGQQIPKGVALRSDAFGAPETAYVLNTLENTVSVVDVSSPVAMVHVAKIPVGNDPTPDAVRRGRIALNNAFASSTGTFSCGSCHPDGHTDQLLWRIGGACFFGACTGGDEIRSTMPLRGLKNTLPLHWDGVLGDPFGGSNGAEGAGSNVAATCSDEHGCFLDLVTAALSGVMCDQTGNCPRGGNELSVQEQSDMASFLASVSYPPPRSRPMDDQLSSSALAGFGDFFMDRGGLGSLPPPLPDIGVRTCADMDSGCHALPLGADHSSVALAGFDAPTMRGMTDRFLQFSIGITNAEEVLTFANTAGTLDIPGIGLFPTPGNQFPWDPAQGFQEKVTFGAAFQAFFPIYAVFPTDIFQMFEEASTGFSGALGRQATLNSGTTSPLELAGTEVVIDALELADQRGSLNLRAEGVRRGPNGLAPISLSYRSDSDLYVDGRNNLGMSRAQMLAEAAAGDLLLTLTGQLSRNFGDPNSAQPLLAVATNADGLTGNPDLPVLPGANPMTLRGVDIRESPAILVDGQIVGGTLTCTGGSFAPYCDAPNVSVSLDTMPTNGLHLLQVQNPGGPLSNELPICVGPVGGC